MKKEEIIEMEAGRDMNVLISKVVFGRYAHIGLNEYATCFAPYSTKIAWAEKVLEETKDKYFSIKIIMWDHTDEIYIIGHLRQGHNENLPDVEASAPTLSLAICRFALLTFMEIFD